MKKRLDLALIALLTGTAFFAHAERSAAPELVGEGKLTHVPYARNKAGHPSIECASNGRLWATWFAGPVTALENINDYVVLATSADGGETWEEVFVADPDLYSSNTRRAFDPQLWIDPDGILRWFWTDRTGTSATNTTTAATDGVWMAVVGDATVAPSAPPSDVRCIWPGAVGGKPFVLDDGAWGFPVSQLFSSPSSLLVVSTDKCANFSLRGGAVVPAASRCAFEHPQIVPVSATEVHCWTRTLSGTFESVSADGGATWPEMAATTSFQCGYDSARCCIRRLSSGNLLLVKRGTLASADGTGLYAYVSTDGGATWSGGLQLESQNNVYFPDGVQDANGVIRVIYECDSQGRREILMASFKESDAQAGTDSSKTVRLSQPVSEPSYPLNTLPAETVGQALSGDGKTAAAICTDIVIPTGENKPYTIEAWVNPSAYAKENRIAGQYAGGATGRMLVYIGNNLDAGTNDKIGVFFGGGGGHSSYRYISNASIPLNQWTHIAVVQNNRDTRMYVNGVLDSVHNHGGTVAGVPNSPFTIAGIVARASEGSNTGLFKGKLAEIRVWSRARNAGEISRDYRHRLSGFEQDLIGYWRLDDIDTFSILNTVTRQRNMIPQEGHLAGIVEDELALVPRAQRTWNNDSMRFMSKADQYFTSDVTLGANDSYTFEAWVRPCGYSGENRLVGVYKAGQNGREIFELRLGKVGLYAHSTSGNIYPLGGDILPLYTWTHVAMSRSMSEVKFYVNGERVATQTCSFRPTLTIPVTIGGAPGCQSFNGDIRDVRIWSGMRSDEAIATNYWRRLTGGEEGLLGYWPLDKNSGDIVTNLVTDAPCTNTGVAVTWLNGLAVPELLDEPSEVVEGNRWAASFAGKLGNTYTTTDLKLTNDFTIEAWVFPRVKLSRHYIATQFNNNGNGRMLFALSDLRLAIGIWDSTNTKNTGDWIVDSTALPLNQWTHVAAVRAGDTVTLYRNGVAVKSVSNFVDSPILQDEPFRIASRSGPSSESFGGSLAEIRIWNKALSGDEIRRARSHKLRGTESGLMGYFPLDEGSGSVMTNLAKNGSNGTILSMWSWVDLQLEDPLPPGGTTIFIR